MPRGGTRRGAGRKAPDRPDEPLLTYSLTLRLSDVGVLNQLGRGNLSLGLRRLVDQARARPAGATSGGVGEPGRLPERA
jgi:hypothetical protein